MTPEDPTKFIENICYIQRARWPRLVTPETVEAVLLFDPFVSQVFEVDEGETCSAEHLGQALLNYLQIDHRMVLPDGDKHGLEPAWGDDEETGGPSLLERIGNDILEWQLWDADKLEDKRAAFLCRWGLR